MITNEKQYDAAINQVDILRRALEASKSGKDKMSSDLYNAMISGIESQIKDMSNEVKAYKEITDDNRDPLQVKVEELEEEVKSLKETIEEMKGHIVRLIKM